MSEQEIYERLNEVFRNVFDDDEIEVEAGTTADDIEDWDSLEHINHSLCFILFRRNGIHNNEIVAGGLCRESTFESKLSDFFINCYAVRSGLRCKYDTAADPLRRTDTTLTGTSGSLLTVRLLAAASNFGTGQSALGALATIRQLRHYYFVHYMGVDFNAEDLVVQFQLAACVAVHIINSYFRHVYSLLSSITPLRCSPE